jgi:hypothetical protein
MGSIAAPRGGATQYDHHMEISDIKRRVVDTIERSRRRAAERRTHVDEATRAYAAFLDARAVPVLKQIAQVLRAEGFSFTVFTPAGSVRLMSDRAAEDYIELALDTSGDKPTVAGRTSRSRGRRVVEAEHVLGDPSALTEEDIVAFVLKSLEPLVER